ncbi:DUF4870 domain-containing protein [Cellulomonas sp. APG4]|uniref:DUF4870 domain-containing protein n=1 Tax=Cellulomonas sp. APG4 TaxID=1538656 RepID=UPI001ED981E7|nr:DUF4870 domain-containing protein [Cellulomonas sp. APG4]
MTTNPDEPQQPGSTPPPPPGTGATPPPPPGAGTPPPAAQQPPAGGYQAPAGGYQAAPPPGGGYGGAPQASYGAQPPLSDSDQRMWAMLAHIGGILFWFVAPLVIWLIFKDRGRYVDEQAKEALNWQITLTIAYIAGMILTVIVIGGLILVAAGICALVFGIIAAIAANKGEPYRYPFALRLVK